VYGYTSVSGGAVSYACAHAITEAGNQKAVRNYPYEGCATGGATTKVGCFLDTPHSRTYGSWGATTGTRSVYSYGDTDHIGGC
jgi:hypothetical protein